ncbi:MAG: long-chain fatty acid--CoA ligase [Deltaproteobacteria bacterium]|nr:long-chain fatty acid--CoA ligase [Deltaproteobacteria bacterium]
MSIYSQQPWLKHYDPEVPLRLEQRSRCLGELLPETARRFPQLDAITLAVSAAGRVFTSSLSFQRLNDLVERCAASLQRLGVERGDRVALYLPNCPQFAIGYCAALRIGAIAVPFNPLYAAREVEHQLADCGATVMIALSPYYDLVKQVQPRTALRRVVVTRIKDYFGPLLWSLYTLTKERREARAHLAAGDLRWDELLRPGAPTPVAVDENDTAVLLYTGGTTGVSKGVELTHRNLVVNAEQNRAWARLQPGVEKALTALPLFHAFGLTCGLNLGLLLGGTVILVPNPRDFEGLCRIIHRLRPTAFPAVPTLLVAIGNLPRLARYDLRSIRLCPCAGSPLAPAVQRAFTERTGVPVIEGYGLTEAAPTTHGNPVGACRPGTIGLPYPGTAARIVDLETGTRELELGADGEWTEPGELLVRGPQVMKGYWNRPQETAQVLRDGWLHTGDIAQMHRDGYFRIVDRKKDMIIRSGHNIYPAEVEAVLLEHPAVLEALVVGQPDALHGELVKACVVLRPGADLDAATLTAFCGDKLARFKVPSIVEFRGELPKSAVGKPLRRSLRSEPDPSAAESERPAAGAP